MKLLKRGEVWWVSFSSSLGGEIQKKRPAVIISDNAVNQKMNRVQVVPLSSKVRRIFKTEALVFVGGKEGKALANQIQTVAKERLLKKEGTLSVEEMKGVERALKIQLALK